MFPPAHLVPVSYLLDSALLFLALRGIARLDWMSRRTLVRAAALSVVVFVDACLLLLLDCSLRALVCVVAITCLASASFPDGQTADIGRSFGRQRFAVYLLAVFTLAMLVYVYLPITTFLTSPGEIGIHLEYLLTANARSAMVVLYTSAALYAFALSPRMKSILALVAMVALLLGLIYAYVYPFGYPMMNGLMFEQIPIPVSDLALRALVDIVTVVLVTWLSLRLLARWGGRGVLVGMVLANVSLAFASGFSAIRDWRTPEGQTERVEASVRKPIRFGKTKDNVLVLMLDRFMGGFVEQILDREPQLASALDGFVWYPRTVAAGENSIAGVHPLLGGYDYTPREMNRRNLPLRDVSTESFAILPYNFTRKGYAASLVNPRGLGFTMEGDCSFLEMDGLACSHVPAAVSKRLAERRGVPLTTLARSSYADLLVLLGLMRSSPYAMRATLRAKGPWRPFLDHSAGTTFKEWAELVSLPELSTTDSDLPNLNIVFNTLPHEPYFLGEDCLPRPSPVEPPREELRRRGFVSLFEYQHFVGARCALLLVSDYFRWMMKVGVYTNTKIVIVSDHGIRGAVRDRSSRAVAGGTTDSVFVRSRSVLFVKERGARGPLRVSEDFMPNAEVPRIVCEEIGGCVNPYLGNKTIAAHGRDVPFFVSFVPWQFNLQHRERFDIQWELALLKRDPYDYAAWRQVRPGSK